MYTYREIYRERERESVATRTDQMQSPKSLNEIWFYFLPWIDVFFNGLL